MSGKLVYTEVAKRCSFSVIDAVCVSFASKWEVKVQLAFLLFATNHGYRNNQLATEANISNGRMCCLSEARDQWFVRGGQRGTCLGPPLNKFFSFLVKILYCPLA